MSKRKALTKKVSKKIFSSAGAKTNALNTVNKVVMRGGIRL